MQTCYNALYFLVNFMKIGCQLEKNMTLLLETVTYIVILERVTCIITIDNQFQQMAYLHNCIITIKVVTHVFAAETVTSICAPEISHCITATETVTCITVTERSNNIPITESTTSKPAKMQQTLSLV